VKFKAVIPARLGSTRLPQKVLRPIHGKPLVQYVWQAARDSGAEEVIVATDAAAVEQACRGFGAEVAMTAVKHASGTDRIHEVAQQRRWSGGTIVVNVQGDEPMMPPAMIRQAAELLAGDPRADIATLAHPLHSLKDWLNPNFVKVVLNERGHALYFSRAPIPWRRASTGSGQALAPGSANAENFPENIAYRHIGVYAYRVAALHRFSTLPPAALETVEALEQLRALSHGMTIRVGISREPPPRGVDTEEDLAAVTKLLPH
jgi:3-deoxy-manno-octulosonate cytidylyltransferase (CMP-KDO synthetase)